MKKIAIVGTRSRNTSAAFKLIEEQFWKLYESGDWIVSGGCPKGADRFAEMLAKKEGIPILIFYPDYKRNHFKVAPTIRNGPIALNSDIVIACVRRPEEGIEQVLLREKGGTEDMLKKFVNSKPEKNIYLESVYLV